ncbi:hypothetical protein HII36_43475 [Nonomuraea sp. NN258]|uniref:hypothetical protein n=1 Tax=Nonomuraea antri TaxID=2730852 RepID=UPI001568BDF2|nr:hypothetical protein [Nonomuraea antri]NRQ38639.1 hypothetical protein [Nonomuraea antri]
MTTEEKLAQALRTIADRAENQDVLPGVLAERRRRRRGKAKGTLAAVCAAALGWGAVVVWPAVVVRPAPQAVVDTAGPSPTPPEGNAVERVWPHAVFTMPARFRPLAAISATEVLAWDERGTLEVYDATTEDSRTVAALARAPRRLAVDRERVVWLADGQAWVAPLRAGGRARKVGPVPGENVDRVALAGQDVVWSAPLDGVWRMRIDGGVPERVPGSRGLQLVEWPWATDEPLDVRTNPTKLVNLRTGSQVEIRPASGVEGLRCGPTWCAGTREGETVVQRSDGSRSLGYRGLRDYPYRDRFFIGSGVIFDARTRVSVTFAGARLPSGVRRWSSGAGVVSWTQDGGVRVVNLAALARS